MNADLGTGLGNGGASIGTATPYSYDDTPTDFILDSSNATQIGALNDGTQIWRVDHQGVDTHAIHFHLFNVEVINRVAIDGQIFPPDAERARLERDRAHEPRPGRDPRRQGDRARRCRGRSVRASVRWSRAWRSAHTFTDINGTVVTNTMQNYGWEYVWHCHLLGHEENDMMRPLVLPGRTAGAQRAATGAGRPVVNLAWTDNASPVTSHAPGRDHVHGPAVHGCRLHGQRDHVHGAAASATTYQDTTVVSGTPYYYRVRAENNAQLLRLGPASPATL